MPACCGTDPGGKSKDPVCGMTVTPSPNATQAEHSGTTYFFCCKGCQTKFLADPDRYTAPVQQVDPVCGMKVAPAKAAATEQRDGETFYFCSKSCAAKFRNNATPQLELPPTNSSHGPIEYICPMDPEVHQDHPGSCPKCGMALEPASPAALPTTTEYTCPMHPEIVRPEPGPCPLCGMALEPREVTAEAVNPELTDMTRRLWISVALSAPMLLLMFSDLLPSHTLQQLLPPRPAQWLEFTLSTPVVLWCGWPFFIRGVQSVRNRSLNMFTLIALGTGAAYLYSVAATFFSSLFPTILHSATGEIPVYFESASVIIALVLMGQVLELRARSQTGSAIRALLGLAPQTAHRLDAANTESDIPLDQVHVGDRLRIRPGEKVPVDGIVLEGRSSVDEAMISGEPIPIEKEPGAHLTGGTINGTGSLLMQAQRVGADTLLAHIVTMVSQAQRTRAPIQRLADRVASWFVPAVILSSILTFAAWLLLGPEPRFAHALINAVAVLIVACPCALGLATPMSIMVGTGRAAEAGILVRNAEALELLGKVDTLVLDKTGTLTVGKPTLTSVLPQPGFSESDLLTLAASLEQSSEHPLAVSIVTGAKSASFTLLPVTGFASSTGKGVSGTVSRKRIAIGNTELFRELGVAAEPLLEAAHNLRRRGQTVVLVAIEGQPAGILGVSDPIKPSTPEAIQQLKALRLKIIMLSGDNEVTAAAVARQLDIDFQADVRPEGKAQFIQALQSRGALVAMAGDGINDAPALAQATVGIAMGTGTDVAIEAGSITLLHGDLRSIIRARSLSQRTMTNIRQNLFFAFIYNMLGVPLAAGVLYPIFGLLLSPMIAAAAMSFSSVSVITNSLRLRKVQF